MYKIMDNIFYRCCIIGFVLNNSTHHKDRETKIFIFVIIFVKFEKYFTSKTLYQTQNK